MNDSGYKLLGFVVWRVARWYVRRRYGRYVPSRRVGIATAGVIGLLLAALVFGARRSAS